MENPRFILADGAKGSIIPADLLASSGTFQIAITVAPARGDGGLFFKLESESFLFALSARDNMLIFERNDCKCIITLHGFLDQEEIVLLATWDHENMSLYCGNGRHEPRQVTMKTSPISAPPDLIRWTRMSGLVPTKSYSTKYKFRQRVYTALASINEKIHESDAYLSFWNIEYDGQKILGRLPKTEVEIQPLIKCFLSDQMLLSGIEMIAEPHTGSGNIDFLLLASVDNIGLVKICIEVKLAHSKYLERGYLTQLPKYMKAHEAEFGAYCVLDFSGKWFDKPDLPEGQTLRTYLNPPGKDTRTREQKGIRIFVFSLAKPMTASNK